MYWEVVKVIGTYIDSKETPFHVLTGMEGNGMQHLHKYLHSFDESMMPTVKITMNKIIVFSIGESYHMQKRQIQMKWFIINITFNIATDDLNVSGSAFASPSRIPTTYSMAWQRWNERENIVWAEWRWASKQRRPTRGYLKLCAGPLAPSRQLMISPALSTVECVATLWPRVYTRTFQCLFSYFFLHNLKMADSGLKRNIPIKLGDFSVIDTEFSSIRERFDAEMRKMEEEMSKFRSELMNRESNNFFKSTSRYLSKLYHFALVGNL